MVRAKSNRTKLAAFPAMALAVVLLAVAAHEARAQDDPPGVANARVIGTVSVIDRDVNFLFTFERPIDQIIDSTNVFNLIRVLNERGEDATDDFTLVQFAPGNPTFVLTLDGNDGITGRYRFQILGDQYTIGGADGEDFESDSFLADTIPPSLTRIARHNPTARTVYPAIEPELTFRVTFSEGVREVDEADFTATGSTAGVSGVAGVGVETRADGFEYSATWDVTISGGDLDSVNGAVSLGLAAGARLGDEVGNLADLASPDGAGNQDFVVDNDTPVILMIEAEVATIQSGPDAPTFATFTVTFSEPVTDVNVADFAITGTITGTPELTVSRVASSPPGQSTFATWTVNINVDGGSYNGEIGLALAPDQNIRNADGDTLLARLPTGAANYQTIVLHDGPPVIRQLIRADSGDTSILGALRFDVSFSELVTAVNAADFTVTGGSTGVVTDVEPVPDRIMSIGGAQYADRWFVTAGGGDLETYEYVGPVGLEVDPAHNIQDQDNNGLIGGAPSGAEMYDRIRAGATEAAFSPTALNVANATTELTYTFNRSLSDANPTATYISVLDQEDADVTASFTISGLTQTGTSGTPSFRVDIEAPADTAGIYRARIGGTPDFLFDSPVTTTVTERIPGAAFTSGPFTVDTLRPRLESISRADAAPARVGSDVSELKFTVIFTEDVRMSVSEADFMVTGDSGAMVTRVNMFDPAAGEVTVSGGSLGDVAFSGVVGLALASGADIRDLANNALTEFAPMDPAETWVVVASAPSITSIMRVDAAGASVAGESTPSDELIFRVTFSEDVKQVDATDFVVGGGSTGVATAVAAVGGTTTAGVRHSDVWDVTVGGGNLAFELTAAANSKLTIEDYAYDGRVRLAVATGRNIQDLTDNLLLTTLPEGNAYQIWDRVRGKITRATFSPPALNRTSTELDITFAFNHPTIMTGPVQGNYQSLISMQDEQGVVVPGTEVNLDDHEHITYVSVDERVGSPTTVRFMFSDEFPAGSYRFRASPGLARFAGDTTNLPFTSDLLRIDRIAPSITSITRHTPMASTASDSLIWEVVFSESVDGVDETDFVIATPATGTATTATITEVTGAGATRLVTASGGDLDDYNGEVGLTLAGTQNIQDSAGNLLDATLPDGENYQVWTAGAPRVVSASFTPGTLNRATREITFNYTFSEAFSANTTFPDVPYLQVLDESNDNVFSVPASEGSFALAAGGNRNSSGGPELSTVVRAPLDISGQYRFRIFQNEIDFAGTMPLSHDYISEPFTVDTIAPSITSITRHTPRVPPPSMDNSLIWEVVFSEVVDDVDTADFAIATPASGTATTATITEVTGAGATRLVTVRGGDLAAYNAEVGLTLAGTQDIQDPAGNALDAMLPEGENYQVWFNLAARVVSASFAPDTLNRTTREITFSYILSNELSVPVPDVGYLAVLDESNNDVFDSTIATPTEDDFALAAGGNVTSSVGPALTAVVRVPLGISGQYRFQISVFEIPFAGRLPFNSHDYISAPFTVDTIAPSITSITRHTPMAPGANADSLIWEVVFSEVVDDVVAADFMIATPAAGTATTATITEVTGAGNTRLVTASGGDLANYNGEVGLTLAGTQDIRDPAGNALDTTPPVGDNNQVYMLDNDAPSITSIARSVPSSGTRTNVDTLGWRVTFSEAVTVDNDDFSITFTNPDDSAHTPATVPTLTAAMGADATIWNLTATGGDLADFDGTVVAAVAMGHGIADTAGNALTNATPGTAESWTLDNTAPTISTIARSVPSSGTRTNVDTLGWRVTFSEAVTVDNDDFSITFTNPDDSAHTPATAPTVTAAMGADATIWDLTATGGDLADFDGTVVAAVATGHGIADTASNALTNATPGSATESWTVDNDAPTVTLSSPGGADNLRSPFTLTVAFSEAVPDFEPSSTNVVVAVSSGEVMLGAFTATTADREWTVPVTLTAERQGTVTANVAAGVAMDAAGNNNTAATEFSATFDTTDAPSITAITRATPATQHTNADSLTWEVVFSEVVNGVDAADFEIATPASGTATTATITGVAGAGDTWRVTASGGNLDDYNGEVGIALASAQDIMDVDPPPAPLLAFDGDAQTFIVDNAAPTATFTVPPNYNLPFAVTITFNEPVTGFDDDDGDVTATNAEVSAPAPVGGSDTEYTAMVTPDGSQNAIEVTLAANAATDRAGNMNAAQTATSTYQATVVTLALDDNSISENGGMATVTATISPAATADTTITVSAAAVSPAVAGDFTLSSNEVLAIAMGATESTGTVTITAVDNTADSNDKEVMVTATVTGATTTAPAPLTLTIEDDDLPTVSVTADTSAVDEGTGSANVFTITRAVATSESVAVQYTITERGVASSTTQTATIDADQTAVMVALDLSNDTFDGATTVGITLVADAATYNLGATTTATRPITDNDLQRIEMIAVTPDPVVEGAEIIVTLTRANLAFNGLAATLGGVMVEVVVGTQTAQPLTVAFAANSATGSATFSIPDNSVVENDYQVTATVQTNDAYTIAPALTGASVAVTDNDNRVDDPGAPAITSLARHNPTSERTNADSLTWRVMFNEHVTGVEGADFMATGLTNPDVSVSVDGSPLASDALTRSVDVTVTGGGLANLNGEVSLQLAADAMIRDGQDENDLTAALPATAQSYTVDNTAPTISTIARSVPSSGTRTNVDTLGWRVTFSEAVTVDNDDFSITFTDPDDSAHTPATVPTVTAAMGADATIWDLTATGGDLATFNGAVVAAVATGHGIADTASNALTNTTPGSAESWTLDNDAPTLMITAAPTTVGVGGTSTITFTFTEEPSGFALGDVTPSGAISNLSGTGTTRTATFTAGSTPAEVTIRVAAGAWSDQAGNPGAAATATLTIVDVPTPTLSAAQRYAVNGTAFAVTIGFDQDVTGFDAAGDITVTNGAAAAPAMVGGSAREYTAMITPDGMGAVVVGIARGVAESTQTMLANAASAESLTITLEPATQDQNNRSGAPRLESVAITSEGTERNRHTLKQNDSLDFVVTFNEPVLITSVNCADFVVPGGFRCRDQQDIRARVGATLARDAGDYSRAFDVAWTLVGETDRAILDVTAALASTPTITDQSGQMLSDGTPTGTAAAYENVAAQIGSVATTLMDASGSGLAARIVSDGDLSPPLSDVEIRFGKSVTYDPNADGALELEGATLEQVAQTRPGYIWTLSLRPDPGATRITVTVPVASATAGADRSAAVTATFNVRRTQSEREMVADFMLRRGARIMAARPNLIGLLDGSGIGASSLKLDHGPTSTFAFAGTGSEIAGLFGGPARGLSLNEYDRAAARGDLWMSLTGARTRTDDAEDDFYSMSFGAHRRVGDDHITGAFVAVDQTDASGRGDTRDGSIEGRGWLAGPYLVGRVADRNLYYQVHAAWGRSSNDISPDGVIESTFETERLLVGGELRGSFRAGQWTLSPAVSADWFREEQDAYLSGGFRVDGQRVSLGEIRAGPEFRRVLRLDSGADLSFKLGLHGVHNLAVDAEGDAPGTFEDGDTRGQVEIEFGYVLNGAHLDLGLRYDGIGQDDYESWGANLRLRITF